MFGSSSAKTSPFFLASARKLGTLLAERGHVCINGGGRYGVMGALNEGVRAGGGQVIGVIHEMWTVDGDEDTLIHNMVTVAGDDLEERKRQLLDFGACVITLPGGVGTFDELWDCVCCKVRQGVLSPLSDVAKRRFFSHKFMHLTVVRV